MKINKSTTIMLVIWTYCFSADSSPESIVKAYVNALVKGELSPFFSYNWNYRIHMARERNKRPKTSWKELEQLLNKEAFVEYLNETIGTVSYDRIIFTFGCGIFFAFGKTDEEMEEIIDNAKCLYALDFLYEPKSDMEAKVLEVRPGFSVSLDMKELGIYENNPTWEAFIQVKYLNQNTAPVFEEEDKKVKEVVLKMNIIKITHEDENMWMRADLLGFGGFSVDALTEIVSGTLVTWK